MLRIDFIADGWDQENKNVSLYLAKHFQLKNEPLIRVFQGLSPAVFETVFGLALFYSHKKNAVIFKGNSYAFQGVLPYLYKDGFQIQTLNVSSTHDFLALTDGLKKETSFVLLAEDHPTTGEIFDTGLLEQYLNDKKIFCIRISHHLWRRGLQDLSPYSVRICSVDLKHSFVQFGDKLKSPTMTTHHLDWRNSDFMAVLADSVVAISENQKIVTQFEANLPAGFEKWNFSKNRFYDRAVFYHPKLNAEALIHEIDASFLKSSLPGYSSLLECVNFARLKKFGALDEWWEPPPTAEQVRGLLLASAKYLESSNLQSLLSKAEAKCRI